MLYDVFICHASEDKESFVRPLAIALQAEHVEVWYDEFSLTLGDSIRRSIDKGLRQSRFGIVVLSPALFSKNWPQYELDGLVEREMRGRDKIILPIWHEVTSGDVMNYSPALAGRQAVLSVEGIQKVVDEILQAIRPQGSPLIAARDTLLEWGLTPPVITDKYWLDIVEASNRSPGFGAVIPEDSIWSRWSFPLPSKEGGTEQWGERLAWAAMQMNWVKSAEELPISPLTDPKEVLDFIHAHPGLFETCLDYPDLLVEYAPQLSIPGFGGDLEEVLEEEYGKSCVRRTDSGSGLTVNGRPPLCDEEWALRHPTFGNYKPTCVTHEYFNGGMFGPLVSPYNDADHAFWLLSSASSWLPQRIRSFLLEGMVEAPWWSWGYVERDTDGEWKSKGELSRALYQAVDGERFKWSKNMKDDVLHRIELTIKLVKLPELPEQLFNLFIENDFPGKWIKAQQGIRKAQAQKRNNRQGRGKRVEDGKSGRRRKS